MRLIWSIIFGLIVLIAAVGSWYVFIAPQPTTTLIVAAGERGSDSYTLMGEVAEVLERHSDTLRIDIAESRNSSEAISAINARRVDLATIESNTPAHTSISLVADLFPDYFFLIARQNAQSRFPRFPVASIEDLPGKRIAIPQAATVGNLSFWSVVDHYKVPPESFRSFAWSRQRTFDAMIAGRVDAMFLVSSLRDPFLLRLIEEASIRGIALRFIAVEQADAMALKRPYLEPVTIVEGAFDGSIPLPREDVATASLQRLLVAHGDTDQASVQELVETIFENRLDLLIRMSLTSAIRDPRREGSATLPIHEGARRYYDRDQPSFLQENAEPLALILTVCAMMLSALLALRRNLASRAKNRGDDYNHQLLRIAKRARETDDMETLQTLKRELIDLLEIVVEALDKDRISEDAFQSFAFLWGSTKDTINNRIARRDATSKA
ncbi:MAG: hypothetical protein OXR62_03820 [Ahrensia sp.]|nr:hypothetical protein [Ahrensia sp.]